MSTELQEPPTPSKLDPPSDGVKSMAAKFLAARTDPNPPGDVAAQVKKDETIPPLVTKTAVDRILTPPKPVDPPPALDPLAEFKDDKTAAANIPKMRELIGKNLEEIKTLRKEVEEAKKTAVPGKEQEELRVKLETLQKERDQLAEAVKIGNPEKSDEYQQMGRERSGLIDKMTNRLTDFGGDGAKLKEALSLSGKAKATALKEALGDLDVDDRTVLRLMAEDLEKLDEKRKDFLTDADKNWSTKQQERTAKERETQEVKARELAGEIGKLKQTLPEEFFMLRTAEESPEWNEAVSNAFTEAEAMARGQRPRDAVLRTLAMGLRAGHLAELFKAERAGRLAAEEKLAGRANAGPSIRGQVQPKPSNGEHKTMGARFAGMLASGQIQGD
jgi:hypothetical protein